MATIYGGDEVNAVVLDLGTSLCRAGYAGDDTPKAVFTSMAGVVQRTAEANGAKQDSKAEAGTSGDAAAASSRDIYVGSALDYRRDGMEVVSPFNDHDQLADWDIVEQIWSYALKDRLRIKPDENAILLSEPTNATREARERCVQVMFESHSCPALFLAKAAVLSSFAMGRQTSLVIDAGHRATTVCAVHDGYVLQKSTVRLPMGGALLNRCMLASVERAGATIRPQYSFKRVDKGGKMEVQALDLPGTTASYRAWCVDNIAADIKESLCRVSDVRYEDAQGAHIPAVTYELPDGTEIQVGGDRFKVPEVLFQPHLVKTFPGLEHVPGIAETDPNGLPAAVVECINRCDVDIRRELYSGIVLSGGTSLLTQLRERLERELLDMVPQGAKVKVTAPVNPTERRFSTWVGGSILASLGSFQQMWMSKQEYEEHGAHLIHRKAP